MSEELSEEIEEQIKKKRVPDTLIEVTHTGLPNKDESDLSDELTRVKKAKEQLELVVEAEAMKNFIENRDNLLKRIPENRREAIKEYISDDPEKIEQVKASLILQGQDFDEDDDKPSEKTVAGRATMPDYMLPQNQGRQIRSPTYENPAIQKYSDLYHIIRDPTSSAEQKAEAEQILDDAFVEIGRGLRSRSRNNPYSLPSGVVSHCMKCGVVVEMDLGRGTPCPHCGHRFGIDKMPRNPRFEPL